MQLSALAATATCFFCGELLDLGRDRASGQRIHQFQLFICHECLAANFEGVCSWHEIRLLEHLKRNGLAMPPRNKNGLIQMPQ